jgi:hypothetical protein
MDTYEIQAAAEQLMGLAALLPIGAAGIAALGAILTGTFIFKVAKAFTSK